MIRVPISNPSIQGMVVRRVVLTSTSAITAPAPETTTPSVRIRLYWCQNTNRRDLIGTFDSQRNSLDAYGSYALSGSTPLDRKVRSGEVLEVEAERFGLGAPSLTGFGVWVDLIYGGA